MMTRSSGRRFCSLLVAALFTMALSSTAALGQSGQPAAHSVTSVERNAKQLYEEANDYINKKYEDFNRRKIQFDPRLEA